MNTKAQIKNKPVRYGNSWVFRIPPALIETKVLNPDKEYLLMVEEEASPEPKDAASEILSEELINIDHGEGIEA